MKDITPDICDKYPDQVHMLDLPLQSYGQRVAFYGQIETVRCYLDNSKVRETLAKDGKGKVLVVDGNGVCHKALLGDQLAILAIENGWEGIIVFGAIRDSALLSQMDIGIQALGTNPFKTEKRNTGEVHVSVTLHDQIVQPGDYLYADWNGILMSRKLLPVT